MKFEKKTSKLFKYKDMCTAWNGKLFLCNFFPICNIWLFFWPCRLNHAGCGNFGKVLDVFVGLLWQFFFLFLNVMSLQDFWFLIEYYIALCRYGCVSVKLLEFFWQLFIKTKRVKLQKSNFMEKLTLQMIQLLRC